MRYFLIALLAFTTSAHAQLLDRDGDGWRSHRKGRCCWRTEEREEFWPRQYVRHYRPYHRHWRHVDRDEDRGSRYREHQEGYRGWRHPERDEGYHGWWRPPGGWRESDLRDGPRRCRPPMHAAGDADARTEAARNMAIKSWQEQVINEHGERFLNFAVAYVLDEHCDPARVGETNVIELKRCVVTAAPCLTPREGDRPRGEEQREEERR